MDFEILMEGTMIGAELQVLTEADISSAKSAGNASDFADAIVNAFMADAEELNKRIDTIRGQIKANKENLKEHSDEIVQYVKDNKGQAALIKDLLNDTEGGATPTATVTRIKAYLDDLEIAANEVKKITAHIKTAIKKESSKVRDGLVKNFNAANKKAKGALGEAITKEADSTAEKALDDSKALIDRLKGLFTAKYKVSKKTRLLPDEVSLNSVIKSLNTSIERYNKLIKKNTISKIAGLTKISKLELDAGKSIVANDPKNVEKAEKQSEGAISKLKSKIKGLISKVSAQLTDPSIATVAVTVAIALATYLALYGFVKSAGGSVSNVVNVPGTFKAAFGIIKEGSLGKKFVTVALLAVVMSAFAAAGTAGYNFIKKKLSNKG
jgi:hypothetical protein